MKNPNSTPSPTKNVLIKRFYAMIAQRALLAVFCLISASLACAQKAPDGLPLGGVALIEGDATSLLAYRGAPDQGNLEPVAVTGQPFAKAVRFSSTIRPAFDYQLEMGAPTTQPANIGDIAIVSVYLRAIQGAPETGEARTTVDFQTGPPGWSKSISYGIGIPRHWKRFDIPFVVQYDSPAGTSSIQFRMGYGRQVVQLGGLIVRNYGHSIALGDLPATKVGYAGEESDAPWRAKALARIEKIRKGDLEVDVRDRNRKPIAGAKVAVRMRRHVFGFGSALAGPFLNSKEPDAERYRNVVKNLYSEVVLENDLKWGVWEDWGRRSGPPAIDWLSANGLRVRGHNMVWPSWHNLPEDLAKIKNDMPALRKRIDDRIRELVAATKGKLCDWDVVNEPYDNHDLMDILGSDVLFHWYRLAHELDPKPRLTLNDYVLPDGADTTDPHATAFYELVSTMKQQHVPLGGIAFQCHYGADVTPPERVISGLNRFAKLGLPIKITEFDINTSDEALQARYTRDFLIAAFSHPSVDAILSWGFWEGNDYLPIAALFRKDWSLKPNGKAWLDLTKHTWWTTVDGTTDTQGRFLTRGFYGDYEIEVRDRTGKHKLIQAQLSRNQHNRVSIELN